LSFPLAIYRDYFREHKYGLSNLSFGGWLGEEGKGLLVGAIAGSLEATLDNPSGRYASRNAAAPLYGNIRPNRKVRLRSTEPVAATIWQGFLEVVKPDPGSRAARPTAALKASGPMKQIDTDASTLRWMDPSDKDGGPRAVRIPDDEAVDVELPAAGEQAAREQWEAFVDEHLTDYDDLRNRPDRPGTSRMSVHLKYGTVHPRTLLADARGEGTGAASFRNELCFRDFYAHVLWHFPRSARENFDPKFDRIRLDTGEVAQEKFERWQDGRTGFPAVDAAMRQLRGEAWMHNRMRMTVASFLVKDLQAVIESAIASQTRTAAVLAETAQPA